MLPLADAWIVDHLMKVEGVAGLSHYGISKHVLMLFLAAVLLLLTFIPFGIRVRKHVAPKGILVNFLEAILLFFRDEVTRPVLGKEGDKYLPVVWTFFFFILYCNLLGLVPLPIPVLTEPGGLPSWLPGAAAAGGHAAPHWTYIGLLTATGQLAVTGTLAIIAGIWLHGLGIKEQGLIAYLRHIVPGGVPVLLAPFLWFLEAIGHVMKLVALMIRLWANMLGGHALLFAIVGFVFMVGASAGLAAIGPVSIVAGVAIYFLEIFVAFLQAFVFTFLVTIFLGDALHPH